MVEVFVIKRLVHCAVFFVLFAKLIYENKL